MWGCNSAETLFQDLRYGFRQLQSHPGFTAVAVVTLAIGIGANTAVFTAYKAMVARPLDARNPGEMVNLALIRHSGVTDPMFSYPDYETYRNSMHSFSGLIAFSPEMMTLSDAGGILSRRTAAAESGMGRLGLLPPGASHGEFASVFIVSESYLEVLGAKAIRGRSFASIGIPELIASPSVLISENYWQKRFGGDPAVLGKTIHLNGAAVQIVGITPHDFVSYIVVLRTREVGIRMAIGAQKRDILELILREITRPVLNGLLVGMFLAVGTSYLLRGLLYGVNTVDGISFIGVLFLFLAIALVAAYPPSSRAMRVDPMVALRYE